MDSRFRVEVVSKTPNPQQTIYVGLHQCYSEGFALDDKLPSEEKSGEIAVRRLLKGGKGHFSPCELPQIVFNCGWFPHSTMQQIRTHRVGISMPTQSMRYTGKRIVAVADGNADVEDVFYWRPVGEYRDRQGKRYEYTEGMRRLDLEWAVWACERYRIRIEEGFSEEHARGLIPFDVRQHWVISLNARSLMHLLDMRMQKSAQLEAQQLCELIYPHFEAWVPQVAEWYSQTRKWKPRLAP